MTTAAILADDTGALVELCGVSMIERHLRILQRLGFTSATVVNARPEVHGAVAKPSWPRSKIALEFTEAVPAAERVLVLPAEVYCDTRLLSALLTSERSMEVVCDAARTPRLLVAGSETKALRPSDIDAYVGSIRRTLPARCFRPANLAEAESMILDSAQKGTLDFPALVHAPIETAIVRRLCPTSVTPNQVTGLSTALAIAVVVLFARGSLWCGAIGAAIFGILDGVDGKLARTKIETTEIGQWEHFIDHALEFSWWLAIAYSLGQSGQLSQPWLFAALMIGGDLLGKIVNRPVRFHTGRPSHDFSPFERRFRLIAGRRNIYIWMLLAGLIAGRPGGAFAAACWWSMITAAVHAVRAVYICFFTPRQQPPRT